MANAGRVAIVPKGDWSADATYKRLDAVTYNNTLYFAKKDVPVGTATNNTEYWSKSLTGNWCSVATAEDPGIVKPDGRTITLDSDGTIHGAEQYKLPTASQSTLGGIKPDGTTIKVDANGTAKTQVLESQITDALGYTPADKKVVDTKVDASALDAKANKTDLTTPFNFKGSCLSTELPSSAEQNDTWYCTDLQYRKTWNGSEWYQSSMEEAQYADELSSLKEDLDDNIFNVLSSLNGEYHNVKINWEQGYIDGTGEEKNNSIQARTKNIIKLKSGDIFVMNSIKELIICTYDESNNFKALMWYAGFLNQYGNPINTNLNVRFVVNVNDTMNESIVSQLNKNKYFYVKRIGKFDEIENLKSSVLLAKSNWKNKKIVWFGTSIPAGVVNAGEQNGNGSYPSRIGEILGATVYNESQGSSAVRAGNYKYITSDDPMGYGGLYASCLLYSLSLSSLEKQDIINNWESKWKSIVKQPSDVNVITNKDNYINSSWDKKLAKYLSGGSVGACDLYVFDHGYNDGGYEYRWDYNTEIPSNENDRTYFIGAMNFIIRKIKEDNPRAKILIIGHYTNQSADGRIAKCCESQQIIADMWNIPIIETWKYMDFSQRLITTSGYWGSDGIWVDQGGPLQQITMKNIWLRDGIHPSSDLSGKTLKHYADVLAPLINNIS